MCEIDWAALGTWVAVVVALGIALEDKVTRRARLRSERTALAAMIAADLVWAKERLLQLQAYIAPDDGNDNAISDRLLHKDPGLSRFVTVMGSRISAPAIHDASGRLQAFDPDTIRAVADCATMLRAIQQTTSGFESIDDEFEKFEGLMDMLRATVAATIRLLEKADAKLEVHR